MSQVHMYKKNTNTLFKYLVVTRLLIHIEWHLSTLQGA